MHVIVHGGAGGEPDDPDQRRAALDGAAEAGAEEDDPVEAALAAVRVLESDPRFNAGVGGAVQSDGVVRTDAGLMTSDRDAGAACAMPGVEHAADVARIVLAETPHVLVSGAHAVALADAYGIETDVDLLTERTRERWAALDSRPGGSPREHLDWLRDRFGGPGTRDGAPADGSGGADGTGPRDHDTVGAVAFDGEAFAAATSTGGRWLALAGRVGDVPQVGSGFYAAPAGAASATGAGEDIARATLARRAVGHLEAGLDARRAADRAVDEFAELTGSTAGVVVLDRDGGRGAAFNSEAMQTSATTGGER